MGGWVAVARQEEIKPGEIRVVDIDDAQVALINLDGEFIAIEDLCTHDGAEIASGCLIGEVIECARHGARFCVRTGKVLAPPAYEPLHVFPVQLNDGVISVRDDRWD